MRRHVPSCAMYDVDDYLSAWVANYPGLDRHG